MNEKVLERCPFCDKVVPTLRVGRFAARDSHGCVVEETRSHRQQVDDLIDEVLKDD